MMLPAYQNPPYRKPTPNRRTISPPPPARNSSPKRKRPETKSMPPALQIDTQRIIAGASDTGSESPRTAVAGRLQDLDLHRANGVLNAEPTQVHKPDRSDLPRKRLKRSPPPDRDAPRELFASQDEIAVSNPSDKIRSECEPDHKIPDVARNHKPPRKPESQLKPHTDEELSTPVTQSRDEISETPDCRSKAPVSPPLRPSDGRHSTKRKQDEMSESGITDSRFPGTPENKLKSQESAVIDPSVSPTQLSEITSPSQNWLTWHEDEITGHQIDFKADDDGEGINGIGFRPTPAIAYARSQKRRQQVNEWRAREAREARQRRFERRRGVNGDVTGDHIHKRTVRFSD